MKHLTILLVVLFCFTGDSQTILKQAPYGFDSLSADIAHEKIDSIHYESKTVGTTLKALIYIPPGYSKNKVGEIIKDK
jgi:hypothetical protein